jgi:hypothetical protein
LDSFILCLYQENISKSLNAKNVVAIHELPLHFLCHTQIKTVLQPIEVLTTTDKFVKVALCATFTNLSGFSEVRKL